MNTTNTFIRNNSLPKKRSADILVQSVAVQRVLNEEFVILMTHRVAVNFYRISLLSFFVQGGCISIIIIDILEEADIHFIKKEETKRKCKMLTDVI